MTVIERLPVPQPIGIDLSADGKTIIIGTQTHYFYRATSDILCITDRQYLSLSTRSIPASAPCTQPRSRTAPFSSVPSLPTTQDRRSTAGPTALDFTQITGGFLNYSVRNIVPSGDRMHAPISEDDSGGGYARYDVGGNVVGQQVAFGSQP
jgi:hypothetical protein